MLQCELTVIISAGSGNMGYCNQGSGLIGTGLSGGSAPGCNLVCPSGSNLAGQPAPGTPCPSGQTFKLTAGGCAYGLAQCCQCVGATVTTPAPAPSVARKLVAPAPAPGPSSSSEYAVQHVELCSALRLRQFHRLQCELSLNFATTTYTDRLALLHLS